MISRRALIGAAAFLFATPSVVDIWGAGCAELLRLVLLTHSDL